MRQRDRGKPNRREPKPKPTVMPDGKTIRVVCTDKGQHPEVSFGHVVVYPVGDGWRVHVALDHRGDEYVDLAPWEQHPLPEGLPERVSKTYPLKCARCGRNVPLRAETVERIAVGFAAADTLKPFDLSHMS